MTKPYSLAVDIGKTNLKVSVGSAGGASIFQRTAPNFMDAGGSYPHFDVNAIWDWLLSVTAEAAGVFPIRRICVAAHGAAAALIRADPDADGRSDGLALPVLDYEWDGVREYDEQYDLLRPAFAECLSPALPAGLNLGRQIFWQARRFPKEFAQVSRILPYAQYWSWRLSGVAASEVSSLGSHTDLWAPRKKTWSSFVERVGWGRLFAPVSPAWAELGPVLPSVAENAGLDADCTVLTGVHDSNAGFALLQCGPGEKPTVVSTGTWAVTMAPDGDLDRLDESRDMLANVDISGAPVACARFMGGREFSEICAITGSDINLGCASGDIQAIIDSRTMALPDFSKGSGPFGGRPAQIIGEPENGFALASLYAALMIDLELDLLGSRNTVIIEGSFAENEILCRLAATLRKDQPVARLAGAGGVAAGCFAIAERLSQTAQPPETIPCAPLRLDGLYEYRDAWRNRCNDMTGADNA